MEKSFILLANLEYKLIQEKACLEHEVGCEESSVIWSGSLTLVLAKSEIVGGRVENRRLRLVRPPEARGPGWAHKAQSGPRCQHFSDDWFVINYGSLVVVIFKRKYLYYLWTNHRFIFQFYVFLPSFHKMANAF